jgi:NADH oxidase (H2O2-forming)
MPDKSLSKNNVDLIIEAMIQTEMKADQIATFQMSTHPLLTASPVAHQVAHAAEIALE